MVCGSWRLATIYTFAWEQKGQQAFSKNPANRRGKRRKHPSENCFAVVGIRTAPPAAKTNTHDLKKGTPFDDESEVRQGTEPKLLIATAAGLEAFIPNADVASLKAEQIQESVAVPEHRKKLAR